MIMIMVMIMIIITIMRSGRTVLCMKDPIKDNAADNFRPISSTPLMWKLMTAIITESMYRFLESNMVLPNEQVYR